MRNCLAVTFSGQNDLKRDTDRVEFEKIVRHPMLQPIIEKCLEYEMPSTLHLIDFEKTSYCTEMRYEKEALVQCQDDNVYIEILKNS